MVVPIYDQYTLHAMRLLDISRRDRHVVVNAEAHASRWGGMVARRAHGAKSILHFFRHHRVDGIQHTACGVLSSIERSRRDHRISCAEISWPSQVGKLFPNETHIGRAVDEQ